MSWELWLVFVAVWFLAGIPLGPNALNCIAISSNSGFRHALWAVAGILIAAFLFIAAVSAGFATLLAANATLFTVLKICGGAYLIWMGISMWRKSGRAVAVKAEAAKPAGRILRDSILISLSNPKAVLAYAAVFSQFVDPAQPLAPQLAVLVPTAQAITAAIYVGYCGFGTAIGRFLKSARRRLVFNRLIAGFYTLAGTGLISAEILGNSSGERTATSH
ncbi:MAG: LysE family transporter [Pseudomonadota bacterium]|nr:LysE family transporter [Pseudomonadota bacterium]